MFFIISLIENVCNTIYDFSVWPRFGSNPVDNCRFQSHTGKGNITTFLYKNCGKIIFVKRNTFLVQKAPLLKFELI